MLIDKVKILKLFRVKSADTIKKQIQEIKKLSEDSASKGMYRSGIFFKQNVELYEKHIKENLEILIETIFDQIKETDTISPNDEKEINKMLRDYVQGEISSKQNNLKSLMASVGFNQPTISSHHILALTSSLNEALIHKSYLLQDLIEKHNNTAVEIKKKNKLLNTKTITAFATGVLAIVALLTFLYSIGLFTIKDNYLDKIPVIKKFEISDNEILLGNSVKVFWEVSNADSVIIGYGIGRVQLSGSKSIIPETSTSVKLSAFLDDKELSASNTIVVKDSLGSVL